MVANPSDIDFWCDALRRGGYERGRSAVPVEPRVCFCSPGNEDELAIFLLENGVRSLKHFQFADHPREWPGACYREEVELEAVWALRGLREKSR